MIRFLLIVFFLVSFFLVGIFLWLGLFIIGKVNLPLRHQLSLVIVKWAFKVVLFIAGTKVTIEGIENIPKDKAVLYVGNHRSYFDIVVLYSLVPHLTGFVAKKEMKKVPFLNVWMTLVNCLFLDRKDVREGLKTILEGIERIKAGISICIFPEGTRNKGAERDLMPFKEGSLKMAEKTGCPIIPMAIKNTAAIFEEHFPRVKKTHIHIEFGKPIYPNELEKEDKKFLGAYTRDKIIEMLEKSNLC